MTMKSSFELQEELKRRDFEVGVNILIFVIFAVIPTAIAYFAGGTDIAFKVHIAGEAMGLLMYFFRRSVQQARREAMARGDSGRFFDFSSYR